MAVRYFCSLLAAFLLAACGGGSDGEDFISDSVLKLNHLEISTGGAPGLAMDVDGDPATCAPAGDCSDGLDNQFGGLLDQMSAFIDVNAELETALEKGEIVQLIELVDPKLDGSAFSIRLLTGEATEPVAECDWQAETCEYFVTEGSLDPETGKPWTRFDNAVVNGTALQAGGEGYQLNMVLPFSEGADLKITVYMARMEGAVTIEDDTIVGLSAGLIGGAIPKALFLEAIDSLPEDSDLPVSDDLVKSMLDQFIVPDIDTDEDGAADAVSIGIRFEAIKGATIGLAPESE